MRLGPTTRNGKTTCSLTRPHALLYDTDFKGALSSVCTSLSTSSCTSPISSTSYTHDAFGRIATSTQTTGVPYLFSYSYSQADQLTQITYPSGRQINYSLDGLGRVQTVQNVRRAFVLEGFEAALARKKRTTPPTPRLLDGAAEAKLIAMRLGKPPAGHGHWTRRLKPTGC